MRRPLHEVPVSERDIFLAVLGRDDPAARAAYLDDACGGDAGLRTRIEALLRAHDRPDSLLDAPVAAADTGGNDGPTRAFVPGSPLLPPAGAENDDLGFLAPSDRAGSLGRLGHYEVSEVLGRGGFGIVSGRSTTPCGGWWR
jgi:hypothetical protein